MVKSICVRFSPCGSGFVNVSRDDPLSIVVVSHASRPAGVARHDTDVAESTPVCFSPDRSAPGSSGEVLEIVGQSIAGSPVLASPGMDLRHHVTPGRLARIPPPLDFNPSARTVETVGLAPEGVQYLEAGLACRLE